MRVSRAVSLALRGACARAPSSLHSAPRSLTTRYEPRYAHFQREVLGSAATPAALAIAGGHGRPSSFEVTVARAGAPPTLIYSKLSTGRFPDFAALAAQITSGAI